MVLTIPFTNIILYSDEPGEFLAPDLPEVETYLEPGDTIEYAAPSGKRFNGVVRAVEYDDTSYSPDGCLGVWWVTLDMLYPRDSGLLGTMRRVVPSEAVRLLFKASAD